MDTSQEAARLNSAEMALTEGQRALPDQESGDVPPTVPNATIGLIANTAITLAARLPHDGARRFLRQFETMGKTEEYSSRPLDYIYERLYRNVQYAHHPFY